MAVHQALKGGSLSLVRHVHPRHRNEHPVLVPVTNLEQRSVQRAARVLLEELLHVSVSVGGAVPIKRGPPLLDPQTALFEATNGAQGVAVLRPGAAFASRHAAATGRRVATDTDTRPNGAGPASSQCEGESDDHDDGAAAPRLKTRTHLSGGVSEVV